MRPLWSRPSSRFAGRATLPGAARATAYRVLFDLHRMPAEWDGLWWRLGPLGYVEDARDATARPPKTRDWAGTSTVTAALHAALDDPDPLVRRAAVENATLVLDRGTVERLLRLFDDPAAADDRPAILTALGSARDPRAAGPVLAVLRRHSENVEPPPARDRRRPSASGGGREGGTGEAGGGRDPAAAADRRAAGHRRTGGGRCGPRRPGPPQPPRRGSPCRRGGRPGPDRRGPGPAKP